MDFGCGPYGCSFFCKTCGQSEYIAEGSDHIERSPGKPVPRRYSKEVTEALIIVYGLTWRQADVYQMVIMCNKGVSEVARTHGVRMQSVQTVLKTARTKVNNATKAP